MAFSFSFVNQHSFMIASRQKYLQFGWLCCTLSLKYCFLRQRVFLTLAINEVFGNENVSEKTKSLQVTKAILIPPKKLLIFDVSSK